MKTPPRVGSTGEASFVVESQHTIAFEGSGVPPVLSTPSLIWFLEHAAIAALAPALEPGELSLGTEVEVQHLAPTPVGGHVQCTARIVQVDGPVVGFIVEGRDGVELVARGFHRRRIVRAGSFARRVAAKSG